MTIKLVLRGKPEYINRMFKHLKKEHPSVRHRISIVKSRRRK